MKKLLLKLSFFTPLVILLTILQHFNRTSVLFNKTEDNIAKSWLEQKNVAFSFDYDDRMAHKYHIQKEKTKEDIIVLGSSRSAKIDHTFFGKKSFFNNNVTGANLEDYIGIYQLYRSNNKIPNTVILGVDPWILNDQQKTTRRWLDLAKEFYTLTDEFPITGDRYFAIWYYTEKIKNYFFIPYFQFSIKKIAQNLIMHDKYFETADFEGNLPIVHYDGSISESLKLRSKNAAEVESEIKNSRALCPAGLDGMASKEKEFLFVNFLQTLQNDGVKIIFWLAPFHPLSYGTVKNDPQCHLAIEAELFFRRIAQKNNIEVIGSYDPAKYNLTNNLFYDSIHPKRAAIRAIFEKDGLLIKQ